MNPGFPYSPHIPPGSFDPHFGPPFPPPQYYIPRSHPGGPQRYNIPPPSSGSGRPRTRGPHPQRHNVPFHYPPGPSVPLHHTPGPGVPVFSPHMYPPHAFNDMYPDPPPMLRLGDVIEDLIRNDCLSNLPAILQWWKPPYKYRTRIELLLHDARCCKEWAVILRKLGYKEASDKLFKSAVEKFSRRYSNLQESIVGSKMSALFEAVSISLKCGFPIKLPIDTCNKGKLLRCIRTFLPSLHKASQKEKLMKFIFIKSNDPKSGSLSQFTVPPSCRLSLSWLIEHEVHTTQLCEQLLGVNGFKIDVSEIKVIRTFDDATSSVVLHHSNKSSQSLDMMIDHTIRKKMPKSACVLIQRNPDPNTLKRIYRQFDNELFKLFASQCNPCLRGDLLRMILFYPDEDIEKKYIAIRTVIASGDVTIQTAGLNLKELFSNNNIFSLILSHPVVLTNLLSFGVIIDGNFEEEIMNILIRNINNTGSNIVAVCDIILILLENGINVNVLKQVCGKKKGNAVLGATELAAKSGNKRILEIVLEKTPGRRIEESEILMESYAQQNTNKPRRRRKPAAAAPTQSSSRVTSPPPVSKPHTTPETISKQVQEPDKKSAKEMLIEKIDTSLNRLLEKPLEYFHEDDSKTTKDDENNEESDDETDVASSTTEDVTLPTLSATGSDIKSNDFIEEKELTCDDFAQLPWTILISKQAADFLKGKKTSKRVIRNIKAKLHALGEGHRGDALCHRNIQPEDNLYETYLYRESRIIWQETIQYSENMSTQNEKVYSDVIRVLWIATKHTPHQLNDVLQKIKAALKKSRNSQVSKPLTLLTTSNGSSSSFKIPRKFIENSMSVKTPPPDQIDNTYRPLPNLYGGEYSLMQFHPFHEFLDAFLNSDISNYDTPICMSPQEHDIIHLPYKGEPIILCGRSGTGKTTTCIYRMWNEYRTFCERFLSTRLESPQVELKTTAMTCDNESEEDEGDEIPYLNQVFVTKSPVLCSQVQKHFEKLVNGYPKLKKLRTKPSKEVKSLRDYPNECFPLFLTSRQFLLLLDNSLPGKPFFCRNENGDLTVHLCNSDYNQDANPDLLFEDNTENDYDEDPRQTKEQEWIEVTADYFCEEIWPRLQKRNTSSKMKNSIDPLLVWMEIQSFIKGSMLALKTEGGHLSREDYVNQIGKKMAPSFTDTDRHKVYDYFEEYKNILQNKAKNIDCDHLFDECDIVYHLFKRFPLQRDPSWHIGHFYVDEIQDFTQAELSLLLKCSLNPSGTFCTGDTAQSIMKGVFFRFEDLRSQFWELANSGPTLTTTPVVPKPRQLTDNFRAHSGILNLAQSIIRIMKKQFRKSFQDAVLPVEVAMFEGPQPILLDAKTDEELTSVLLGNVNDGKGTQFELGAHQAILVRSEAVKEKLPDSLKHGIVLTVLEAKGLEFNDVLLYDFFKDSPVNKEWRLLENFCDNNEEITSLLNHSRRGLDNFDEESLKSLLAELKYLYTAITRAKVNLWVYDSSANCHLSAFYFWISKGLARLMKSDDGKIENNLLFAAPSEEEQWSKQGDYYFRIRRWKLALTCYQRANLPNRVEVTRAYMLVEDATKQPRKSALPYYQEAALAFLVADENLHRVEYIEKVLRCLKRGGLHEQSAKLLEKTGQIEQAAREWSKTDKYREYARVLEQLEKYSDAIRAYVADGDYKTGLQKSLQFEKQNISLDASVSAQQMASDFARQKMNEGDDESLRHMMTYISDGIVKADFLKEAGLFEEAVEQLLKDGRPREAIRLLKAKSMFKEGQKYFSDRSDTRDMFRLHFVTEQMLVNEICDDPLIFALIDNYRRNPYIKPQAEFLYAKHNNDIAYYRKSISSYESFKCVPGKLMVHKMRVAQNPDSKLDLKEMLIMSRDANEVGKAVEAYTEKRTTRKQRNLMKFIIELYDIEEEPSHYCISGSSYLFAVQTGLNLKISPDKKDIDGMLILDKNMLHEAFFTMYEEMCHTWLGLPEVQEYVKNELQKVYTLNHRTDHTLLLEACILLCTKNLLSSEDAQSMKENLLYLFSFSLSFPPFVDFDVRNALIRDYFVNAVEDLIKTPDITFDVYLLALTIFNTFGLWTGKLRKSLRIKAYQGDHLVLKYERPTHIFFWWLHALKKIYDDRMVIAGCNTIYHLILSHLNEFGSFTEVISMSSIVDIASIMSSLLIITINVAFSRYKFIVPIDYENLCDNFNSLYGNGVHVDVKQICLLNTGGLNAASDQLLRLLDYLIGYKRKEQGILQMALSSESSLQDGSSQKCLVLCLVLAANFYLQYPSEEYHSRLFVIQQELQKCRRQNNQIKFVNTAYVCLQSAKNMKDIFDLISQLSESHLSRPTTTIFQHSVVFKLLQPPFYPQANIRRFVTIEDPEESPAKITIAPTVELTTNSEDHNTTSGQVDDDPDTSRPSMDEEQSTSNTSSTIHDDSNVQTHSYDLQVSEPFDDDDYEEQEVEEDIIDKDIIDEDRECLACGEISKSDKDKELTNKDINYHLESNQHLEKMKLYKKWKEIKEATDKEHDKLIEKLNANKRLIHNQAIEKRSKSEYKKTLETINETLQQSFDWSSCIILLEKYQSKAKKWLEEVLTDKPMSVQTDDQEDEEKEKDDLLSPKEKMVWSKNKSHKN